MSLACIAAMAAPHGQDSRATKCDDHKHNGSDRDFYIVLGLRAIALI